MAKHSFSTLPNVKRRRTRFSDPWQITTTMSVGKLYPIMMEEVLAGDDFNEKLSAVARLTSAYLKPVMDNLFLDTYAFFVPGRLCYDKYEEVFANSSVSAYQDNDLATIPSLSQNIVSEKSVADYLGLPLGAIPDGISVLPFRAFALIYNEWFRNENTTDETFVQLGEIGITERLNNKPWSQTNYMGQLPRVGKIKDYFTSCVPAPQKGQPVTIPVVSYPDVPIAGSQTMYSLGGDLKLGMSSYQGEVPDGFSFPLRSVPEGGAQDQRVEGGPALSTPAGTYQVDMSNLVAKTSTLAPKAVTVDDLRLATQKQLMLVADTMYGSRYREYLFGHFGVSNGDARMQVPEFLCGKRIPLSVQQVAQTSSPTEDSPLAALAGYSYTVNSKYARYFKGFSEPGYIFWVGCIRQKHTYQQGVQKKFTRLVRDEFYDPLYSHIGYQPVYTSEIYAKGESQLKGNIFGWREAWSEYKHTFSTVSGEARSDATNSLDIYHFADLYENAPVLGAEFNEEVSKYVDRTLSVPSTSQDQFIVNFYCESIKTRVMPLYCEPGYMDHWNK